MQGKKWLLCVNLRGKDRGIIPPSPTLKPPKNNQHQNTTQQRNQQQPQNRIVIDITLNKAM